MFRKFVKRNIIFFGLSIGSIIGFSMGEKNNRLIHTSLGVIAAGIVLTNPFIGYCSLVILGPVFCFKRKFINK